MRRLPIFNASTEVDARLIMASVISKYEASEPKLAEWIAENIQEGLTVLQFPAEHRRRLRTSNSMERVNKEIKRRTRVVGLFPNENSVLRLVTALAMEISEDWESGRVYLWMEVQAGFKLRLPYSAGARRRDWLPPGVTTSGSASLESMYTRPSIST